jgi:hypothetical protein
MISLAFSNEILFYVKLLCKTTESVTLPVKGTLCCLLERWHLLSHFAACLSAISMLNMENYLCLHFLSVF